MTSARTLATGLALGIALAAGPAAADYPSSTITMLVPFTAGGGTDVTARTVSQFLEREIGGTITVVNRPGAGGEIALSELAEAAPDGYTLGIINTPGIVTIPIAREARFSTDSFDFLAGVVEDPATISVLESSPIQSIEDLVEAAHEQPGQITVATQGVGSAGHISLLLLEQAAGVTFRPIPYSGAADGRTALLAGDVMATTANLGEALTFAEGNPWRILGVMSTGRSPLAPDLPTFGEAGYPVIGGSLRGFGGPAGMPEEVVTTLSEAIGRILENPEFQQLAEETNQPLRYVPREDYLDFLAQARRMHEELWAVNPWQ